MVSIALVVVHFSSFDHSGWAQAAHSSPQLAVPEHLISVIIWTLRFQADLEEIRQYIHPYPSKIDLVVGMGLDRWTFDHSQNTSKDCPSCDSRNWNHALDRNHCSQATSRSRQDNRVSRFSHFYYQCHEKHCLPKESFPCTRQTSTEHCIFTKRSQNLCSRNVTLDSAVLPISLRKTL